MEKTKAKFLSKAEREAQAEALKAARQAEAAGASDLLDTTVGDLIGGIEPDDDGEIRGFFIDPDAGEYGVAVVVMTLRKATLSKPKKEGAPIKSACIGHASIVGPLYRSKPTSVNCTVYVKPSQDDIRKMTAEGRVKVAGGGSSKLPDGPATL